MSVFVNGRIDEFHQHHDTDGNIVNASDGGVIYAGGRYHWYGMALQNKPFASGGRGGQVTLTGVNMYASDDLEHWEYEGVVLKTCDKEGSPLRPPMRFERPKIVYNENTKKYVLWCHYVGYPGDHGFSDAGGEALVAVSDRVNGEYSLVNISRPIDRKGYVRDSTLFKDEDGSAYFIYDRHVSDAFNPVLKPFERCLHAVKLTDDYLGFTDTWARLDACDQREAPCVVRRGKYCYMLTSGLTGWAYNRAKYFRAESPLGPWEDMGDPCAGDEEHTSFRTQGTYIFTADGRDVCMCERHNTKNFLECSYVWLPLKYRGDGTLSMEYSEEIRFWEA